MMRIQMMNREEFEKAFGDNDTNALISGVKDMMVDILGDTLKGYSTHVLGEHGFERNDENED